MPMTVDEPRSHGIGRAVDAVNIGSMWTSRVMRRDSLDDSLINPYINPFVNGTGSGGRPVKKFVNIRENNHGIPTLSLKDTFC
jgi:hypothetical protein